MDDAAAARASEMATSAIGYDEINGSIGIDI
jgi:hypothetical protein